jgi:hypothetical protein
MTSNRAKAQTTEIVADDEDLELEPELPNEPPRYPRWLKVGQRWAVLVDSVGVGTDFNGDDCTQIEGELAAPALNFDKDGKEETLPAGTPVRMNAGQPILDRQLKRNHQEYGLVGRIVYITYKGEIRTKTGRTAKDFDVRLSRPITFGDFVGAARDAKADS